MMTLKESNLMRVINNFLKDQKGSFAILFVILSFIALLVITACSDILKQSYVLNEVQGIMDTAGVSALNASVDTEKLREEEFYYNEDTLRSVYNQIIDERIHTGNIITYKKLLKTEVLHEESTEGLGVTSKPRHQLWLDSVMLIRVKTSKIFDLVPGLQQTFYDSKSNGNFTVTVNGQTDNGETELIVRSVTRLVYR
jgi:Flp pilus assembly pilin Flp